MPDIFGKNPEDYLHIRALQDADLWERHQDGLVERAENKIGVQVQHHNFDALGSESRTHDRAENAQAIGYLTDNLLAIQSMVDEILYTPQPARRPRPDQQQHRRRRRGLRDPCHRQGR